MTAVIGIMNKQAIAIAADSAVTVSGSQGRKVYNTANKIFTLSKYHPVSIVIYSSASLMYTPWEIIIKEYRNQLKNKEFDTVVKYSQDFFKYLKKRKYFSDKKYNRQFLKELASNIINMIIQESHEKVMLSQQNLVSMSSDQRSNIFLKEFIEISATKQIQCESQAGLKDFENYSKTSYESNIASIINELFEEYYDGYNNPDVIKAFNKLFYSFLKSKNFYGQWTGLVFVGYGKKEIYPATISTKVGNVVDGHLRYFTEQVELIDNENGGSIMPFAQRDVIDTLITGIDPLINGSLSSTLEMMFTGYNNHIADLIRNTSEELANQISNIDVNQICNEFLKQIEDVKEKKHIIPTVDTVSILSKEDLAEMAESLIYLTYLKRRISSDEESVGGPVDVAIISKGDGFVWIKRKNYFESNQNPHFIKNYFNH